MVALLGVPASIGYPVLFGLVAAESAGALVPGESALIVSGALAGRGQLSLPLVIVTAAAAAILGENVGYVIALEPSLAVPCRQVPLFTLAVLCFGIGRRSMHPPFVLAEHKRAPAHCPVHATFPSPSPSRDCRRGTQTKARGASATVEPLAA